MRDVIAVSLFFSSVDDSLFVRPKRSLPAIVRGPE